MEIEDESPEFQNSAECGKKPDHLQLVRRISCESNNGLDGEMKAHRESQERMAPGLCFKFGSAVVTKAARVLRATSEEVLRAPQKTNKTAQAAF